MKLSFMLLFVCVLQLAANNANGQNAVIRLSPGNLSVGQFLNEVERQTNYLVIYSNREVDTKRQITIKEQSGSVAQYLKDIFDGTSVRHEFESDYIVLTKRAITNLVIQNSGITVTGTITDDSGGPMPGVNVLIKGSTAGVITDIDGKYTVNVSDNNAVLVFSFIGFTGQEIQVGGRTVVDVIMSEDIKQIEEVVVVGYGVQKKVNLTGAVSSVNFEKDALTSRSVTNISTAMAGMSSGIRTRQDNGLPNNNNEASISIRGIGSLNLSSAPLVLVDGQVADINSVSPNDVATISVLKDAASAAIYGSRASNGVILITTKNGSNTGGKVTFNYNGYVGKKSPTQLTDVVSNTADHMTLINWAQYNSGITNTNSTFTQAEIDEWREGSKTNPLYYPNTNWWDVLIQSNIVMNHNLSARGGNERINFYTSFDFYDDDGLIPNTSFRKLNFRNNLTYQVNNWLKLGNNLSFQSNKSKPTDINTIFQWFRGTSPGTVGKSPDGRYGAPQTRIETGTNNPIRSAESVTGEIKNSQVQGKVYGVLTPLNGLSVTASYFVSLNQQDTWQGNNPQDLWNFQTNEIANVNTATKNLTNSYQKNLRQVIDLYADYGKTFGNHDFKVLFGFNQEYYFTRSFSGTRQELLSLDTPVLDAASGEITDMNGNNSDYALRSFFGRVNYSYHGRYLFEANMRYDGSSRFSSDERWGFFPSASIGWIISEEDFFSPLKKNINSLKVRASYGQLGNNGIGNYEWQNFYSSANYVLGGSVVAGLAYSQFGNSIITWEKTNVLNIGADLLLFSSLSLDFNYYNKLTDNILARLSIPSTNGGITAPRVNAAQVRNSGIEVEARYRKSIGKVDFNVGVNFGYNKNKIEKYQGDYIHIQNSNMGNSWTEGQPIGIWYIREVDHIIQNQSEVDAMVADGYTFAPAKPGPGDFLYKNNNGDKLINDDDRILKGNPIPLFTYGGNIGAAYAGFDFNIQVDGVGRWDRYIQSAIYALNHNASGYLYPKTYMNQWREDNPSTTIPKVYTNSEKNNQVSDYFLFKADYFKIRSLQLGYSLPPSLLQQVKIDKVRVYVNLENYFTFTDYPAMDPETDRSQNDDVTYPLSKIASIGLSISF